MCVDLLVGTQNARAVAVEPAEPERKEKFNTCGALSVYDTSGFPLDALSVCDNSSLPSGESGNLLNMIMDSGAEEHVVSLVDWKSLGEPVLKLAQFDCGVRLVTTFEFLAVFMVRGWCDNQMVEFDSSGGDSSFKVSVFCDEAGECWLQHRDEVNSVCFAS